MTDRPGSDRAWRKDSFAHSGSFHDSLALDSDTVRRAANTASATDCEAGDARVAIGSISIGVGNDGVASTIGIKGVVNVTVSNNDGIRGRIAGLGAACM